MKRRSFLKLTSTASFGAMWPGNLRSAEAPPLTARHLVANLESKPSIDLERGKRLSFGWTAAPIAEGPAASLTLRWPENAVVGKATRMRVSVALDMRETSKVEAALARSGRGLGVFDVRFGSVFQPYEIPLAPDDAAAAVREGVTLRLIEGRQPLWIWTGGTGCPAELQPHLLVPGEADVMTEFYARMRSVSCVQQFGWMEGCVLDGLLDLSALPAHQFMKDAVRQHLALFLRDGKLVYENPVCAPNDGRIYGIEGTLPFAALAQIEPQSPLLDLAVKFFLDRKDAADAIVDGQTTTSEGSYTVGYPMAVIGRARQDEALQQLALTQLRVRQARLFNGRTFWRTSDAGGGKGNRNWARGLAWQMLGMARTLRELRTRSDTAELIAGFRQLSAYAQPFQRGDGLWNVFIDDPNLTPDTGGSAGIGAALAIGAQQGWLGQESRSASSKCLHGLRAHLTPDGFLGGVSQSNKGGEALQRGSYRVIYPMGMGLMAQLIAAIS